MDKKNLAKYAKLLEEKRQILTQTFVRNRDLGAEATKEDNAADMVDMATNAYTKEFLYSLSNGDRQILKEVEEALVRVKDTDFGECEECNEKMTKKRLEVIPWARYCVSCQELVESGRMRD